MPVFATKEQAVGLFTQLFEILLQDETFAKTVRSEGMSVLFQHVKPEFQLFVDADGVRVDEPIATKPTMTIKMSCDTADSLWSGTLLMPVAVALGKIRIRGSVSKVIEFVPLLHPAFDQYPQLRQLNGIGADLPPS